VKMYAMVNVEQYQIVATGQTVADCEINYRQMLANNNLIEKEDANISAGEEDFGPTEFEIADIRTAVIDGSTNYFIGAGEAEGEGQVYFQISMADDPTAAFLQTGDGVLLYYDRIQEPVELLTHDGEPRCTIYKATQIAKVYGASGEPSGSQGAGEGTPTP